MGWVDQCRVIDAGEIVLSGWAASLDDGSVDEVVISLDGNVHRCSTDVVRAGVRAVLGDDRLDSAGWELIAPLPQAETFVEVSARSRAGETALLYAGWVRRERAA